MRILKRLAVLVLIPFVTAPAWAAGVNPWDTKVEYSADSIVGTGERARPGRLWRTPTALRQDLVEQRERKQTRVRAAIQRAREIAAKAQTTADPAIRAFLDDQAKGLMREARTHLDKTEPYLAAVRAVFREFGLPH